MVRLSALRIGRLYPRGDMHDTHFCWRLSRHQGCSAADRIKSMKNSQNPIVNRTRYIELFKLISNKNGWSVVPGNPSNFYSDTNQLCLHKWFCCITRYSTDMHPIITGTSDNFHWFVQGSIGWLQHIIKDPVSSTPKQGSIERVCVVVTLWTCMRQEITSNLEQDNGHPKFVTWV